jgi:hypothetical protein
VAVGHGFWWLGWWFGWLLVVGLMWAMVVVVVLVFGEDAEGVVCVDDQDVIEDFAAQGADDSFAVSVCCRRWGWRLQVSMSLDCKTASNARVYLASRSRMRNRRDFIWVPRL